ncbi:hypothetical protein AYO27_13240 [Rhizobium sp. GHKF11]|nr:hypothetical protein AYO27_13240 [Rhizobium sp. GHKF11]
MIRSPIKIQLTVQGGGAKFVTMLPAARAFADQRKSGHLDISRVSGASAGSIIAALIATHANFLAVSNFLQDKAPTYVQKMKGRVLRHLPKKILRYALILKLWRGHSIVDPSLLKGFLTDLFSYSCTELTYINPDISMITIGEAKAYFKCDIRIALSSLDKLIGEIAGDEHLLIDALVDSCSIPLFFRNTKNIGQKLYVDGGLCENLPTTNVMDDVAEFGDLFAITTVDSSKIEMKTPFDMMMAVFGASINHNVRRSMAVVGEYLNVSISSAVTTFDFDGAIAFCSDKNLNKYFYDQAFRKIASYSFIKTVADQPSGSFNSGRYDADVLMSGISQFQKVVSERSKKDIISTSLALFCDSLNWTEARDTDADIAYQKTVFRVFDQPVYSVAVHLPQDRNSHYLHPMKWQVVKNATNEVVASHIIPMKQKSSNGIDAVYCCVYFEIPLIANDGGHEDYTIEVYTEYIGSVRGLKSAPFSDYLAMTNLVGETIEEVNLIMLIPKTYRRTISVQNDPSCNSLNYRTLTAAEISNVNASLDMIKYEAIGCRYENLKSGERARANFGA